MAVRTKGRNVATMSISGPPELLAAIEALAERNKRNPSAEVCHAIERHLQQPPTLATPAIAAARVDDATPRAKPGRKKREG